jgi:hypothetical protein
VQQIILALCATNIAKPLLHAAITVHAIHSRALACVQLVGQGPLAHLVPPTTSHQRAISIAMPPQHATIMVPVI